MLGKKVIQEKPLTLAEVRLILKKREDEGKLNYEQKVTQDYVKVFGKTDFTKIKKALKKLEELQVPKEQAVKIINIQPTTEEEIAVIFDRVKYDFAANNKKLLSIAKEL